jgi:hypothetical protein
MFGWGLNLVTTVIGFGMSAAFIIFVCGRLICCRIRSRDSHVDPPYDIDIELRSDLGQPVRSLLPYISIILLCNSFNFYILLVFLCLVFF